MKGNHWFIAGIIVFLVLMFAIECRLPKKFVWNPTFSHYDKQPFGCAVFDSLLSSSLPKGYSLSRKTFYELEQEDTTLRRGILVVTDNIAKNTQNRGLCPVAYSSWSDVQFIQFVGDALDAVPTQVQIIDQLHVLGFNWIHYQVLPFSFFDFLIAVRRFRGNVVSFKYGLFGSTLHDAYRVFKVLTATHKLILEDSTVEVILQVEDLRRRVDKSVGVFEISYYGSTLYQVTTGKTLWLDHENALDLTGFDSSEKSLDLRSV